MDNNRQYKMRILFASVNLLFWLQKMNKHEENDVLDVCIDFDACFLSNDIEIWLILVQFLCKKDLILQKR